MMKRFDGDVDGKIKNDDNEPVGNSCLICGGTHDTSKEFTACYDELMKEIRDGKPYNE